VIVIRNCRIVPLRRRMLGHIPMHDPSRADVEDDKDIEDAEASSHGDEEVTGQDRGRMIPHKRRPTLGLASATRRPLVPEISSDGGRRDGQPRASGAVHSRFVPRPKSGTPGSW
jgi:hypothetical protein